MKEIRGESLNSELNTEMLLTRISEEVRAWREEFRPVLRDDVLQDPRRFVLLDPKEVKAELFPKVFWCQNRSCGRVFDYSRSDDELPQRRCRICRIGSLVQLRFVKVHRCGALQALRPPVCRQCHASDHMALDTRGSERVAGFQWICRRCNRTSNVFAGYCTECQWPGGGTLGRMSIQVHRAGSTFYPHTTVLLNIPRGQLDAFLSLPEWPAVAAAKFLSMPGFHNRALSSFTPVSHQQDDQDVGLSNTELEDLLERQARGELTPAQVVEAMQAISQRRQQQQASTDVVRTLVQQTGVEWPFWQHAGQEMLEVVMPKEEASHMELFDNRHRADTVQIAHRLGISELTLVPDYPVITATYGFSRSEYSPNECRINPFSPQRSYEGRFPIFVDQVQADALLVSLDADRVLTWLERNGHTPTLPNGTDKDLARRAYFVRLFDATQLRQTLMKDQAQARLVFGLLHMLSHLCVRQAALLCGLDRTSLSEYLMPKALTLAIYCNHRFGATIGALTALFEQSLAEWLNTVRDTRRCVYDPVCHDHEGACHACAHLAETSCRFFNLNLNGAFLFGGHDPQLANVEVGYFDLP